MSLLGVPCFHSAVVESEEERGVARGCERKSWWLEKLFVVAADGDAWDTINFGDG